MTNGDLETARLFFMAGGLEGPRVLPESGGLLDQAAVMLDAWGVIRAAALAWKELHKQE